MSGGHATDLETPVRLELSSYSQRQGTIEFVLLNDAHTSRVELYSRRSQNANTKIATNLIMQELLDYLDENGFFEKAVEGSAPEATGGKALELELDGNTTSWYVGHQSPLRDQEAITLCYKAMLDVYNNIFAAQSVENKQGESIFGKKRRTQ